jgi:hypothetical protein
MVAKKILCAGVLGVLVFVPQARAQDSPTGSVSKLGEEVDIRSGARILADELANGGTLLLPDNPSSGAGDGTRASIQTRGGNVQVNDPSPLKDGLVQIFPGFRPFVRATQSEVSVAASGRNIVVTFNDSTGLHVSPNPGGPGLIVDQVKLSGFSVSNDGGQTWTAGLMPPAAGATETFGDPSVGVDRHGVFYFAQLGTSAGDAHGAIVVNKSTDDGRTWAAGAVVQIDDGSDKEWLAVGPDPSAKNRDNVYVTWTSFQTDGSCQLRFGRSIDGGSTFTARTIYAPPADPNPAHPQNCLTFSNPVVDQVTGTLYVPFLHFSNADQDFVQMLISDDAGATFRFATFNVAGAPDPTVVPVTQSGELTACGGTNLRLTIHGSLNAGPGLFGLPRYVNASRMTLQPAVAARNGVVYLAWSNSTSPVFGLGTGSNVLFIRSNDGGSTWSAPILANPAVAGEKHHVLPALAIDTDPNDVHIGYYTQHADNTVDLDLANSHDGGASFPSDRMLRVTTTSMSLPPTNIPLSNAPSFASTNYDRQIAQCYALGEYQSVTTANGSLLLGWGDTRNLITEPANSADPISGQTHPQEDVFFQQVKAQ